MPSEAMRIENRCGCGASTVIEGIYLFVAGEHRKWLEIHPCTAREARDAEA